MTLAPKGMGGPAGLTTKPPLPGFPRAEHEVKRGLAPPVHLPKRRERQVCPTGLGETLVYWT